MGSLLGFIPILSSAIKALITEGRIMNRQLEFIKHHRYPAFVFIMLSLVILSTPVWSAVNHNIFEKLLSKYNSDGTVDYAGLKYEEKLLDSYLESLAGTDIAVLSRKEKFAFYANAYNAWTIKLILSGYPGITSIKDMGSLLKSPWKKKFVRIGGKVVTLDHIEHDILRPQFKDPRVHFVVNCASKGCPPLLEKPLTGISLDAQLDSATKNFINNPRFNRIEGNRIYVSSIFKWFKEDFEGGVMEFFHKYATGGLKIALDADKEKPKIKYLDYDWTLNGK
jgi:hypothetical protein